MGQKPSTGIGQCLLASVPNQLVALPNKIGYMITDVKPYNLGIPVDPAAVTYPTVPEQVQAIVKCASTWNMKVQARSGGHSYGNYGTGGGDQDTIVVDLKNMKNVTWDNTEVANVGAGILLSELTETFLKDGNRAIAHGTCPQVGLGGHATIGGLGPASRMWGAALDHVVGATVVLANSSIVQASETENSDLFWGLKGAGASFGVITEFKIKTHEAPSEIIEYSYTFQGKPFSQHADRFKAWQALISNPQLSQQFASQVIFTEIGMIITGTYFGSKAEWDALNLTSVFPSQTTSNVTVFNDWLGAVGHWAEDEALQLVGGIPSAFYSKSLAVTPDTLLPDTAIDKILAYLDSVDKGSLIWFVIFDLEGGATNEIPADATSYAHRDALYYLQAYVANPLGAVSTSSRSFLNTLVEQIYTLVPTIQGNGAYAGYVDPELGEDGQKAYWRQNYPRLQTVKGVWDPSDMFRNPQSVRLQTS